MERIFISYRREDGAAEAWLLQEKLSDQLGGAAVFLDTSSVSPGTIWPDRLRQALDNASAALVVIGPNWIKASDEWSRRRIDLQDDWVRLEVEKSLNSDKAVLPVLVRGAVMPPGESLPSSISALALRQAIELRNANDVDLIARNLIRLLGASKSDRKTGLFPRPAPELPDPLSEEKIEVALRGTLHNWRIEKRRLDETSPDANSATHETVGLYREYRFQSFRDAVSFMHMTAPGCDIAIHHPVWENIWRTVRIFLTTWDIDHRISDRDVQLAKYFERAYEDFPAADPVD
ncbi:4a-hydroxytetrahydrobiopterin dehydratase [Streptomyces sp. NPDC046859]|uniref:4a-hydroxytetrahydrobiopterin dehydratase n=1 Tax=Streptomyces sp. NPDC046859 TaxID=3155734 RepID=UPI0033E5D2D7